MRKKIGFALSLAAAAGFQAVLAQPLQARPSLECDNPPAVTCANYAMRGFGSHAECVTYYSEYCPLLESGEGGCVYDPRIGQTICF